MITPRIHIGTAGWVLPAAERASFGEGASNLSRYATRFNCVEINSSFYRRHRPGTWRRWAESVPEEFRFAVKLPKTITHVNGLNGGQDLIDEFASDTRGLSEKFSIGLVQLPPRLSFDACVADAFFAGLRSSISARIVCEPRHASWFESDASDLLQSHGVARVAADPAIAPGASIPGGSADIAYWRLHGSPQVYRSPYEPDELEEYSRAMSGMMARSDVWCIFDNTAASAATRNALDLLSTFAPEDKDSGRAGTAYWDRVER